MSTRTLTLTHISFMAVTFSDNTQLAIVRPCHVNSLSASCSFFFPHLMDLLMSSSFSGRERTKRKREYREREEEWQWKGVRKRLNEAICDTMDAIMKINAEFKVHPRKLRISNMQLSQFLYEVWHTQFNATVLQFSLSFEVMTILLNGN